MVRVSSGLPRGPAAETGKTDRAKKSVETERATYQRACVSLRRYFLGVEVGIGVGSGAGLVFIVLVSR
jgi:hypothetical protein